MSFIQDTFTDADATALASHTGEAGATWTRHPTLSSESSAPTIVSNRLRYNDASGAHYYASGTPASADYPVSMDLVIGAGTIGLIGVSGRLDPASSNGYFAIFWDGPSEVRLYKYVSGSLSQVGTGAAVSPASGETYRITLDMSGTAIKLRFQRLSDSKWLSSAGVFGTSQVDAVSATDSSHSSAGKAGLWVGGAVNAGRADVDNFNAVNPSSLSIADRVDDTDYTTGRAIMVLVPNANSANPYDAGTPTRCIIYCHGVGEDDDALLDDALKADCVAALIDAGYILAGTNDGGWGKQASVDDYAALANYLLQNYNLSGFGLWSQSMGALSGLLVLSQQKVPDIRGWLGTYPMCSLEAAYSGTGGTNFSSSINTAYGITGAGNATYENLTFGHDPCLKWGSAFRSIPMRFYASEGDTVVGKTENTDVFYALIVDSCRESAVVVCTGDHGDPSHFVDTEYVAFFDRCFDTPAATEGEIGAGAGGGGTSVRRTAMNGNFLG